MPTPFLTLLRSVQADGYRRSLRLLAAGGILLVFWFQWFLAARVPIYATSGEARLVVAMEAHPVVANVGAQLQGGERLGPVVPPGELKVVADFPPPEAVGRIREGQPAQVRLDGFPWTQYGTVEARVRRVAREVRDGRIRVECEVQPDPASPIPFQHGLTGTVEIEVERVSPLTLVLRAAGRRLTSAEARAR